MIYNVETKFIDGEELIIIHCSVDRKTPFIFKPRKDVLNALYGTTAQANPFKGRIYKLL